MFVAWFNVFRAGNYLVFEIKWVGTGKELVAMVTNFFIAVGVFFCRTISLPSFNGLRCKFSKIALFIYML